MDQTKLSEEKLTLNFSENALKVLEKRYLKKDVQGKVIETPVELFRRVARHIAEADRLYGAKEYEIKLTEDEFFKAMTNLEFVPNSPTLMNAGRDLGQLSACFVLPVEDSMESIFDAVKATAIIHKTGGGTGFSFSRLRPKNSVVRTTGGISSGPVSFMKVFNAATQAVKQGGTRRGANMGILRVDHPDILEFITCKENDKEITNFNISVALTEDFMNRLLNDEEYDLIDPHTKQVKKKLKTKEVFNLIVEMAHKNGEPGIIFIDRMNQFNPTPKLGQFESTNPCGEQQLLPYESCNLGSINVSKMVIERAGGAEIDWEKLRKTVHIAVHFLDNVIDMNKFPLKEIETMTKLNRKIGLGVMGWADMLIKLGIPYDSEEAVKLGEEVMKFIYTEAQNKSSEIAKSRGVFPSFEDSIYNTNGKKILRNATVTTIAPAGTISIIAGCSSGIEPVFALSYYRNVMDNERLIEVYPLFEEVAKREGFYSKELMERIAEGAYLKNLDEVPETFKRIFVTAHDIKPIWHIRMQGVFQKYTDNAVSKTVNFPKDATKEDVREVYMLAYKLGCKGVTIYRDKSREEQVLNLKTTEKKSEPAGEKKISPKPRPVVTTGTTTKIGTGCGNLYVTINVDSEGKPFEVFTQMGKAGGCAASQLEAIGRLVSLALRSGVEIKSITDQLRGIRCPSPSWEKGGRIFSCADAIARVIEERLLNGKVEQDRRKDAKSPHTMIEDRGEILLENNSKIGNVVGVCPDCGGALRHEEGCMICRSCGYSKC